MAAKGKYEEKAPIVLTHISNGYTVREAAQKAGIDEHTVYEWQRNKPSFYNEVQRARADGEQRAIAAVEQSLLDLALGDEYEEVATEYESKPNPDTNSQEKYIPVIKKQKRIKKRVVQSIEAIRFYLSNKCPEVWKNRTDGNLNLGDIMQGLKITHVYDKQKADGFPSSEAEVDADRE